MQLQGAWGDALEEARRAAERFTQGALNQIACGAARYRQGEIHRLRGELDAAEAAYREASRCGYEPQPGLALLRLAQGNRDAAAAAIRRAVGETTEPLKRAALLPAYVEIMLAGRRRRDRPQRLPPARRDRAAPAAATRWTRWPHTRVERSRWPTATPRPAFSRRAARAEAWQELGAPYEAARARVLSGSPAARSATTTRLCSSSRPLATCSRSSAQSRDLARVEALIASAGLLDAHGLTARELEVLRLVAAGKTNRESPRRW